MVLMDGLMMAVLGIAAVLLLGLLVLAMANHLRRRRHRVSPREPARVRAASAMRLARYLEATRESRALAAAEQRARVDMCREGAWHWRWAVWEANEFDSWAWEGLESATEMADAATLTCRLTCGAACGPDCQVLHDDWRMDSPGITCSCP